MNHKSLRNTGLAALVSMVTALSPIQVEGNEPRLFNDPQKQEYLVALAKISARGIAHGTSVEYSSRIHAYILLKHKIQDLLYGGLHNHTVPLDTLLSTIPPKSERTIRIDKSRRVLGLYVSNKKEESETLLKEYDISLGENPEGKKEFQGDMKTPEGSYTVVEKRGIGHTRFYKALWVSYPNTEDINTGYTSGRLSKREKRKLEHANETCHTSPSSPLGTAIEIHGKGGGFFYPDWTSGCIALTDQNMDEIYTFAQGNCRTRIVITE